MADKKKPGVRVKLNQMTKVLHGDSLVWANSSNKGPRCTVCGQIGHAKGFDK